MHLICHIFRLIPFQSAAKSKISSAWCQRAVDLVLFHCMRSPYACRIAGRLTYTTSSQCGSLIWHAHHTPYTIHSPSPIPERSRPKMKCCSYQKQIWKLVNCIGIECSLARAISIITHAPHRRNICTVNFNLYKHRFD